MNGIFDAAAEIQRFCRSRSWDFCFIGGVAVQRWGEPRQTRDVDLTLITGFGGEPPYIDELLSSYAPRVGDPKEFALRNRVLLLATASGVGIDIALGALPFEGRAVARATDWVITPQLSLHTCAAEDLVVFKAFAGRPLDWSDIEMIVGRQGARLDRALVLEEVAPLLAAKGAKDDAERLRALLERGRAR